MPLKKLILTILLPACFYSVLAICFCHYVFAYEPQSSSPKGGSILKRRTNSSHFKSDFNDRWSLNQSKNQQFKSNKVVPIRITAKKDSQTDALGKIESLFSIIADGVLLVGCIIGGPLVLWGFIELAIGAPDGIVKVILGLLGIVGGIVTPYLIGWLFDYARSTSLF